MLVNLFFYCQMLLSFDNSAKVELTSFPNFCGTGNQIFIYSRIPCSELCTRTVPSIPRNCWLKFCNCRRSRWFLQIGTWRLRQVFLEASSLLLCGAVDQGMTSSIFNSFAILNSAANDFFAGERRSRSGSNVVRPFSVHYFFCSRGVGFGGCTWFGNREASCGTAHVTGYRSNLEIRIQSGNSIFECT